MMTSQYAVHYSRSATRQLCRAFLRLRAVAAIAAGAVVVWAGITATAVYIPLTFSSRQALSWQGQGRYLAGSCGDAHFAWRAVLWNGERVLPRNSSFGPSVAHSPDDAEDFRSMFKPPQAAPLPKGLIPWDDRGPPDPEASPSRFYRDNPLGDEDVSGQAGWLQRACDEHGAVEIVAVGWPRPWFMAVTPLGAAASMAGDAQSLEPDAAVAYRSAMEQMSDWKRTRIGVHPFRAATSLATCVVAVLALCCSGVLARHAYRWRKAAAFVSLGGRTKCRRCGYSRRGLPTVGRCPECGRR